MDETLLQSEEQAVSAWLGTEGDGEGYNFSYEGRYDEEVMATRIYVFTPNPDCVSINLLTSKMRLQYASSSKLEKEIPRP